MRISKSISKYFITEYGVRFFDTFDENFRNEYGKLLADKFGIDFIFYYGEETIKLYPPEFYSSNDIDVIKRMLNHPIVENRAADCRLVLFR